MNGTRYDVVGIGNAIVDVLAQTDDAFLERHGLVKGSMALIDRGQADQLYAQLQGALEKSGGSAGNTMAGLASLGAAGAYIGKVADDDLGAAFAADMARVGTRFQTRRLSGGAPTARCMVLVTPDAQRTMNTYLGACTELRPDDVEAATIEDAAITYLEGYLWDKPHAKEACLTAMTIARTKKRRVALSLSDAFCVERHRSEFLALIEEHVDVLFANEAEICSLFQTDSLTAAAEQIRSKCEIAALTRSGDGSLVIAGRDTIEVAAAKVSQVLDTTGAGDLYAAGFLFGLVRNRPLADCGRWGSLCAAEVIGHFGARPEVSLREWIARRD